MQPLQSLSAPSQPSAPGEMPPMHGPQLPNSSLPWQVCMPSTHAPTPRRPGWPWKHAWTVPGVHGQPSSTVPSQLSSTPLPQVSDGSGGEQPSSTGLAHIQLSPQVPPSGYGGASG